MKKGAWGVTYQDVYLMENLTIEAKAIYGMLCSYAGTGAEAYPSVDFMCDKLKISNTRFYKHMNILVGAGVVIKKKTKNERGGFANNTYILAPNLQNTHPQNRGMEELHPQNEGIENEGDNNNNYNNNSLNNNNYNRESNSFAPPTVKEVAAYCKDQGFKTDPEVFINYYNSKSWMIGKNQMTDWKAALNTWEKRAACSSQPEPVHTKFHNLDQREYEKGTFDKLFINN